MTPARDPLKVLAGPMLAYFDKRFQAVYDRIDERMNELYARVATEVETMSEMTLVMQRFVDTAAARMEALAESIEARGDGAELAPIEAGFALAALGRLPAGARILHVGDPSLTATLAALGYDVSTPSGDAGAPFDCVLWLPGELDEHELDVLGKSLEPGGELVLSIRGPAAVAPTQPSGWTVIERLVVANPAVELVRLTPIP
jgi:hypothetical protein